MTKTAGSFSTPCYCINSRRATNALTAHYDKALAACGLSVGQFSLLRNLDAMGGSNVTALADRVGLERTTVVRNLKPLTEGGFIQDSVEASGRERRLLVTAKGKAALAKGIPLWKQAQKDVREAIGPEHMDMFRAVMAALQGL